MRPILFASALALAAPAAASIIVIQPHREADAAGVKACTSTFNGNVDKFCVGDNSFNDRIGLDFGSTAELAVRHGPERPDHAVFLSSTFNTTYLPGFYRFGAPDGSILFTPASGYEVRMLDLEVRRAFLNTSAADLRLFDSSDNLVWSVVTDILPSDGSFVPVVINSGWYADPLRFLYAPHLGLRNIVLAQVRLEIRPIDTGGGGGGGGVVPEPATWAMLIAGFGLVGGMARRRRQELASA
jgi:hypothetical protein